jgi:hypothetical protein
MPPESRRKKFFLRNEFNLAQVFYNQRDTLERQGGALDEKTQDVDNQDPKSHP